MSTVLVSASPKAPAFDPAMVEPVVELSLLVPTDWARRLHDQARQRHVSVGRLLRDLIGQGLDQKA